MPATLLPPDPIKAGDTFRRTLPIVLQTDESKDLTDALAAQWVLHRGGTAVIGPYSIGDGITYDGSPTEGRLTVTLLDEDTEDLLGTYTQEWAVTDALGDTQKWEGAVIVTSSALEGA